jgi:hypothetical protein
MMLADAKDIQSDTVRRFHVLDERFHPVGRRRYPRPTGFREYCCETIDAYFHD